MLTQLVKQTDYLIWMNTFITIRSHECKYISTTANLTISSWFQLRKHSSTSLALCEGNPPVSLVDSPHKGPVMGKVLPWHDVIMWTSLQHHLSPDSQIKPLMTTTSGVDGRAALGSNRKGHFDWLAMHDDVVSWKRFPDYWHFVRWNHQSLVDSPHEGSVMQSFYVIGSLDKMLNKLSSCRTF